MELENSNIPHNAQIDLQAHVSVTENRFHTGVL